MLRFSYNRNAEAMRSGGEYEANIFSHDGFSKMHRAVQAGDYPSFARLLGLKENPAIPCENDDFLGCTALHFAAMSGHFSICSVLVSSDHRCDINQYDRDGLSSFHRAVLKNDLKICRLFHNILGAQPIFATAQGSSALHLAKTPEIVAFLVTIGANVVALDDKSLPPLHHFIDQGYEQGMIKAFLDVAKEGNKLDMVLEAKSEAGECPTGLQVLQDAYPELCRDYSAKKPRHSEGGGGAVAPRRR